MRRAQRDSGRHSKRVIGSADIFARLRSSFYYCKKNFVEKKANDYHMPKNSTRDT